MKERFSYNTLLIIFLLLNYSCKKDKVDYAIISGKVLNTQELKFFAEYGSDNSDKVIQVKEYGMFRDTVYTQEGLYIISDGRNRIRFYLKPSKEYVINYDVTSFKEEGIELLGNDTINNAYFTEASRNRIFVNPYEWNNEKDIRNYLNEKKEIEIKKLQKSGLSTTLKTREQNKIEYEYLHFLKLLIEEAGIEKKSQITIQELNIDYNNEEYYKTYPYYKTLVNMHYSVLHEDYVSQKLAVDTTYSKYQNELKFYALNIPNQFIKNDIIAGRALYCLKQSDDPFEFYQNFKTFYTGDNNIFLDEMLDLYTRLTKLEVGSDSPRFIGFKNYNGGTNSLDDFIGKPIYINLWATWCGNCIGNLPEFKALVQDYKNRDVIFLNIAYNQNESDWRDFIKEKNMPGIQLLGNTENQSFFEEYGVYGIPRYILLDQKGKIIDYSAPSPTEKELKILLNDLMEKTTGNIGYK